MTDFLVKNNNDATTSIGSAFWSENTSWTVFYLILPLLSVLPLATVLFYDCPLPSHDYWTGTCSSMFTVVPPVLDSVLSRYVIERG